MFKKKHGYLSYEDLLAEADEAGLTVKEKPLHAHDGRIAGKNIAIRQDIPTLAQKACVLAEELGHYHTASGDIMDQSRITNRKQEHAGRLYHYVRTGSDSDRKSILNETDSTSPKAENVRGLEYNNIICMGKVIGRLEGPYEIITNLRRRRLCLYHRKYLTQQRISMLCRKASVRN